MQIPQYIPLYTFVSFILSMQAVIKNVVKRVVEDNQNSAKEDSKLFNGLLINLDAAVNCHYDITLSAISVITILVITYWNEYSDAYIYTYTHACMHRYKRIHAHTYTIFSLFIDPILVIYLHLSRSSFHFIFRFSR